MIQKDIRPACTVVEVSKAFLAEPLVEIEADAYIKKEGYDCG